jgi:hypothetical protein
MERMKLRRLFFLFPLFVLVSHTAFAVTEGPSPTGEIESEGVVPKEFRPLPDHCSLSIESDFRSQYVSYGIVYSNGWVWEPSATFEWKGLGFTLWGNFVMNDETDQGKFDEFDFILYYDIDVKGLTIHPYFGTYVYPADDKNSLDSSSLTDIEPSLYLSYKLGPIDIFLDFNLYVHPIPGAARGETGIVLTEKLPLNFSLVTSGLVGFSDSKYNRYTFRVTDTTFPYFTYMLAFPWEPLRGFIIRPNGHVTAYFQQKFRDKVKYRIPLWGGIDFIYNF